MKGCRRTTSVISADRYRGLGPLLLAALLAGVLAGCAYHGRTGAVAPSGLSDAEIRGILAQWQQRLDRHVADEGQGDPAVLADLPALRSPQALRPGRIVFTAIDIGATVAERDGYDVSGLLLGRHEGGGGTYVFIVGTIDRDDFQPTALVDLRLAAMTLRDGALHWQIGNGSDSALATYRKAADAGATLHFPGDRDRFRLVDCAPDICAEESRSGARWKLPAPENRATAQR
jgi:hypothetical protein